MTCLIKRLKETEFTRIHIDENCIVGWATAFYKAVPTARKEDFIGDDTGKHKTIGEIRNPSVFVEYIYPYKGTSNVKFQYLMDKLNDTLQKKNLGAFYTPEAYAEKSHELLRMAIERVPAGNDYVIIDRCAGTGNLEKGLTDEELSHCIVFSPVKYWKAQHLIDREFLGGFAFNRRHFHTNIDACVSVILWSEETSDITEFDLDGYDIGADGKLVSFGKLPVKRMYSRLSDAYYDKGSEASDTFDGVCLEFDGTSYKDDEGNTVWNNVEVHSALQTLKALVKEYYNAEIVPTLFEYEFLK